MTPILPTIQCAPTDDDTLIKVSNAISDDKLILPGQTVLVALSGGADSVSLLHLIWSLAAPLNLKILAAHLNHEIRTVDSELDAEFCRMLCLNLGVELFVHSVDVPALSKETKTSVEDAGRSARMDFLEKTASTLGDCMIATGHHMDDQAETVLMRAVRGTGIDGLASIPKKRGPYIRPLLGLRRRELQTYLERMGLEWREDETNTDQTYLRNRVRAKWLPLLAQENPNVVEALSTLAIQAAKTNSIVDEAVDTVWRKCCQAMDEFRVVLDISVLKRYPLGMRQRIVRRAWRHLAGRDEEPLTYPETARMTGSLESAKYLVGRSRFRAQSNRTRWMLTLDREPPALSLNRLVPDSSLPVWWRHVLTRTVDTSEGLSLCKAGWPGMSVVDLERLNGPAQIRPWKAGDTIHLAGRSATKSVARLLSDSGVSRLERLWAPVVCDQEGVVLVLGLGEARRVTVTPMTRRSMVVSSV